MIGFECPLCKTGIDHVVERNGDGDSRFIAIKKEYSKINGNYFVLIPYEPDDNRFFIAEGFIHIECPSCDEVIAEGYMELKQIVKDSEAK